MKFSRNWMAEFVGPLDVDAAKLGHMITTKTAECVIVSFAINSSTSAIGTSFVKTLSVSSNSTSCEFLNASMVVVLIRK